MNTKNTNLKEKLKQALVSTARVISDDFKFNNELNKTKDAKKFDFFILFASVLLSPISPSFFNCRLLAISPLAILVIAVLILRNI